MPQSDRAPYPALPALLLLALAAGCRSGDDGGRRVSAFPDVRPVSAVYGAPIYFEASPSGSPERFIGRGLGYGLAVGSDGLTIRSRSGVLGLEFSGKSDSSIPEGIYPRSSYSSYLKGNDRSAWIRRSPHFGRVLLPDVYPGIDVEVYGTEDQTLEFDFVVHPGADPRSIELQISGADSFRISRTGSIEIQVGDELFTLQAPVLYQRIDDVRRLVDGSFVLKSNGGVRFDVGAFDASHDLIVDPELAYSTRLGGSAGETANAVAVDPMGNVVVVGLTGSTDFPSVNAYATDADGNLGDIFVTKFDPAGQPLFSTYLGGTGIEILGCDLAPPTGVAFDSNGNIWFVGRTASEDFPLANQIQNEIAPTPGRDSPKPDVFVAALTATGDDLAFSTYYGGGGLDEGCGLDVDPQDNIYFVGASDSDQLPSAGAKTGAFDGFVAKLNPNHTLGYSTYLGGNEVLFYEKAMDVAAGPDGSVFVVGFSDALDFPPVPPEQAVTDSETDAFLVKLNPDGSLSNVAVDLGGSLTEVAHGVGIDPTNGFVAVVGITASNDFPAQGGPFPAPSDLADQFRQNGFMSVFHLTGEAVWSSYVGGSGTDYAFQVALTENGRGYVVGSTGSPDFPPEGAFQGPSSSIDAVSDGFAVEVDIAEPSLLFWTFIGGSGFDHTYAVDADAMGGVVVAGLTYSNDYPTVNAYQSEIRANDAFVMKFGGVSEVGITVSPNPVQFPVTIPGETSIETVTITSSGTAPLEIQNIDVEPAPLFGFPDEPEFPVTLDAGETLMFEVAYSPIAPSAASRFESAAGSRSGVGARSPATPGISNYQSAISNDGTLTIVSNAPTQILAVPLLAGGIVVNDGGDREDPTPDDGNCDVDTAMEGNQCTLRAAIQTVNGLESEDVTQVGFAIATDGSPPLIRVGSGLPHIRFPIELDGTTQRGSGLVRISGAFISGEKPVGLRLEGGQSLLRGLSIEAFGVGIVLTREPNNSIDGCEISFNVDAGIQVFSDMHAVRNSAIFANNRAGVYIGETDPDVEEFVERVLIEGNTIGSSTGAQSFGVMITHWAKGDTLRDNVIVQNSEAGVLIFSTEGHVVEKNFLGTNRLAESGFGNKTGVQVTVSELNQVSGNTISGNSGSGIVIEAGSNNRIENNKIGTDPTGSLVALGNDDVGIHVSTSTENTIEGNVVSNNDRGGVRLTGQSFQNQINDNRIGTDDSGVFEMPNRLFGIEIEGTGENYGGVNPSSRNNIVTDNIISGNALSGIRISGLAWTVIVQNKIGVDREGTTPIPNGENGIELDNAGETSIRNNTLSGNGLNGIWTSTGLGLLLILDNEIGTDAEGVAPVGNGRNGILLMGRPARVSRNIISANQHHGILFAGKGHNGITEIQDNKIGSDRFERDPLGTLGNRANGVFLDSYSSGGVSVSENFVAYNLENGVSIDAGGAVQIRSNEIRRNVVGIRIRGGEAFIVSANRIHLNVRNIDASDIDRRLIIEDNDVFDGTGVGTGLHLTDSNAIVRRNYFANDAGDAVTLEGGGDVTLEDNSFVGNAGFGVNNLAGRASVDATGNWWGHSSGPGGVGPGSGDAVSAAVDYADWRSEPVGVTISTVPDTVAMPVGASDTASVYVQNWLDRDDTIQISVFDTEGWYTSVNAFEVALVDSMPARIDLSFTIPSGVANGQESIVTVIATSRSDGSNEAVGVLLVRATTADLAGLIVSPDSVTIAVGDTTYFVAQGFDQFGREFDTQVGWFAEGGAIDENGRYVAGSETGTFEVTATTGFGGPTATGIVTILTTLVDTEDESTPPTSFHLHQNYPNPFNPSTTITYEVPLAARVQIRVFDALGRLVESLVNGHQPLGRHSVKWDATRLPSGIYFVRLEANGFAQVKKMILLR